jgi:DegV family protein with EDD domain
MVQIIADTLSSIPVEEAKKLNLPYLPQIIIFGEKSYRDDSELDSATFLQKLKASAELPKTAAPYPSLYNPIFEELSKKGEPILVICPPSKVSGTVRSAMTAANEFHNVKITVLDTPVIGAALGTIVKKALQWSKENNDIDTIIEKINEMAARNRTYFLLDTLEYLRRGGRIGAATALVGGIMQIKPILQFRDGEVGIFEKQRTKGKAFNRLIEIVEQECPKSEESYLYVQQGGAMEDALKLKMEFEKSLGMKDIPVYTVPPAILVHGGPNVCGVSYFVK